VATLELETGFAELGNLGQFLNPVSYVLFFLFFFFF
jgi:hypothetical protein